MSYNEALEDGIPIKSGQGNFVKTLYYPPCHYCSQPVQSWTYIRGMKYACPECRTEAVRQRREEDNDIAALMCSGRLMKDALKVIQEQFEASRHGGLLN